MGRRLDVLGTAEAADELGVAKESISRMIREGRLEPDAKLASGPVFRRSTIEQKRKERST